ncbi:DapH/DapD/GlmU-related protein [Rhodococcus aerolatus]
MTASGETRIRLSHFTGDGYDVGRSRLWQAAWQLVSTTVFMRWWFPARGRVAVLRWFGATVGEGVLVRHRVRIHWPWKLTIGDHSWIGEGAWILNLEPVTIGADVCISQEALLCTGSHRFDQEDFRFDNGPIAIGDGAWVAARATVLRGLAIGPGVLVGAGQVVRRSVEREAGIPAAPAVADPAPRAHVRAN